MNELLQRRVQDFSRPPSFSAEPEHNNCLMTLHNHAAAPGAGGEPRRIQTSQTAFNSKYACIPFRVCADWVLDQGSGGISAHEWSEHSD